MNDTLFDRLGGEDAVNDAVNLFYRKVLRDDRVARFFDDVDMDAQAAKQREFLAFAFGGPNNYTGRQLSHAHSDLVDRGLSDYHFDAIVDLLGETLQEMDVAPELIGEVAAIVESVRDAVLCRESVALAPHELK